MEDMKKLVVTPKEEVQELNDEQLESVTGGLAVPTIGPANLTNLKTGQALPEDTTFKPAQKTNSAIFTAPRLPKNE